MVLDVILIGIMFILSIITVFGKTLLRSAIGLGLISAVLTIIMYRFNSPYAAAFELSVCAGLITVVFISAISLTVPLTKEETIERTHERFKKYVYLPICLLLASVILWYINSKVNISIINTNSAINVKTVLWDLRQIDLVGQIALLLAGVFGVAVLLKERDKK